MKFAQHDRVKCNGQKAKVLTGWQTLGGEATYKIEMLEGPFVGMVFDAKESSLAEFEYEMDSMEVSAFGSSFKINVERECPRCYTDWHVTKFNKKVWYDCLKCKDTKENIVKKYGGNGSSSDFWD